MKQTKLWFGEINFDIHSMTLKGQRSLPAPLVNTSNNRSVTHASSLQSSHQQQACFTLAVVLSAVKYYTCFLLAVNTLHYLLCDHQLHCFQDTANISWTDEINSHLLPCSLRLFNPMQICCCNCIPFSYQLEHAYKLPFMGIISPDASISAAKNLTHHPTWMAMYSLIVLMCR